MAEPRLCTPADPWAEPRLFTLADPWLSTPAEPRLSTPADPWAEPRLFTLADPWLSTPAEPRFLTPADPLLAAVADAWLLNAVDACVPEEPPLCASAAVEPVLDACALPFAAFAAPSPWPLA